MNTDNQTTQLLTVAEASKVLRLKPSTVRAWLLKRKVPFVKLGGKVFLRSLDCAALIEASLVPARTVGQAGGAA